MGPHHQEHMLEVRTDGAGAEGLAARLLEHDGHNVVANVALPQELEARCAHDGWFSLCPNPSTPARVLFGGCWGGPGLSSNLTLHRTFPSPALPSPPRTCCWLLGVYGSIVDTWNMISWPWYVV